MRTIKIILKGLLFLAGVCAAAWFFMPWRQIGESVIIRASKTATVSYSSVKDASGGFEVRGLKLQRLAGMADVSCESLTVRLDPTASLLSLAPTFHLSFTGAAVGDISMLAKKMPGVSFGDGRAEVSVGLGGILIDGIRSNGDLSLSGLMLLNMGAPRPIVRAEVSMNVKDEAFETDTLSNLGKMLPITQESPGHWVMRRAPNDRT
ncbi:MAG: hypothetical protein LBR38_05555 [Synergistaceae bacterium]|jgi:hypothetical protein|nr:hypothetical protein [Synergistaceae bacterium]